MLAAKFARKAARFLRDLFSTVVGFMYRAAGGTRSGIGACSDRDCRTGLEMPYGLFGGLVFASVFEFFPRLVWVMSTMATIGGLRLVARRLRKLLSWLIPVNINNLELQRGWDESVVEVGELTQAFTTTRVDQAIKFKHRADSSRVSTRRVRTSHHAFGVHWDRGFNVTRC